MFHKLDRSERLKAKWYNSVYLYHLAALWYPLFVLNSGICNHFSVQGFDEYMNLVLDDAEEVHIKKNTRKPLGDLLS